MLHLRWSWPGVRPEAWGTRWYKPYVLFESFFDLGVKVCTVTAHTSSNQGSILARIRIRTEPGVWTQRTSKRMSYDKCGMTEKKRLRTRLCVGSKGLLSYPSHDPTRIQSHAACQWSWLRATWYHFYAKSAISMNKIEASIRKNPW